MEIIIDQQIYPVIINRKSIKNIYLRFKDNQIYISANRLVSDRQIGSFIEENQTQISKLAHRHQIKKSKADGLYLLGRQYELIINNSIKEVIIENDQIYAKSLNSFNQWLKQFIIDNFSKRMEVCYNNFNQKIPYPTLKIRKMTSRWGVCHHGKQTVTLNTELIKYPSQVIDYVIIHELCHFIHPHHQKPFWELVAVYVPDYKKIRQQLKE